MKTYTLICLTPFTFLWHNSHFYVWHHIYCVCDNIHICRHHTDCVWYHSNLPYEMAIVKCHVTPNILCDVALILEDIALLVLWNHSHSVSLTSLIYFGWHLSMCDITPVVLYDIRSTVWHHSHICVTSVTCPLWYYSHVYVWPQSHYVWHHINSVTLHLLYVTSVTCP